MEYEPAVFCGRCGRKAPRWISWSVANPGRRYYSCVEAQHGFIQWHDDPTSPFLRVLLGDLRDRKTTEQTARDSGAGASIRDNLVRKGLMLN
uniref:GRF-type domain-containing protein n=1 Tax=Aegilops tauschii TaxID=37682 RepID=N1R391_AEGTA